MAAEAPLVSVIVPVYNGKRYLTRCVRSLQAQTVQNMEIILVDDGSTDGSGALCDKLAAGDKRILAVHQKNGGVSAARNTGLDLARGKYVMFCDSDDTVLPRYCQAHLEAMARPGVALTMASLRPIPSEAAALPDGDGIYRPDYRQLLKLWNQGWLWCCWGKCYDIQVIRRWGLRFRRELAHSEDTVFVVEYITCLLDRPGQICLWQEHLYRYYDTPGSLSKDRKAMAAALGWKRDAALRMDRQVGFPARELEDLLAPDQLGLRNDAFRASLCDCRWYQLRRGAALVRAAMERPEVRDMLALDLRLQVFGRRYRRVLHSGSPLLIYLYVRLWHWKNRMAERRGVQRLRRRRLEKW